MINSFKSNALKRFYERGDESQVNPNHRKRIREILTVLDIIKTVDEIFYPSWKLHPLKGDLKGYWSLVVNGNWRIIFRIEDEEVYDVDLTDYH